MFQHKQLESPIIFHLSAYLHASMETKKSVTPEMHTNVGLLGTFCNFFLKKRPGLQCS